MFRMSEAISELFRTLFALWVDELTLYERALLSICLFTGLVKTV